MGPLHMSYPYSGELDGKNWYAISDKYVQCGQDVFQASSIEMGDEGWETIGYERLQFTSPAVGQYYGGVTIDYGYEVMWKRPKATE